VNPAATNVTATLNLKGAAVTRVNGTATVLTSANASDENSLTALTQIAPVSSAVDTLGNLLKYTFKANSITILKLNTGSATAIPAAKTVDKLSVYPNPTQDIIYIKGDKSCSISVQVRSLTGQLLMKKQIANGKMDLSSLQSGVYILTAQQGNQSLSAKVRKE
jgi:hypothetical protein